MNGISTHVLDTARGEPASGLPLLLEMRTEEGRWERIGEGTSDSEGRATLSAEDPAPGTYRLTFDTAAYFRACGVEGFYPQVQVLFEVRDPRHHHVPLLLSPWGYSTYRGT